MDNKQIAIVLGGILPAILLGLSSIFQKLSTNHGISTGPFLIGVGLTTALIGGLFMVFEEVKLTTPAMLYTCGFGIFWACATGCIAIALNHYNAQISQLVPLYNMNTLVAVLIGLIVLSEWRNVDPIRILIAAVLIIAGGVLASRS
jgi:uncharacterized membrane protein